MKSKFYLRGRRVLAELLLLAKWLVSGRSSLLSCFQFLRPRQCGLDLIRVGGDGDGSYVIPDDLAGIELCISPGVNNCKLFDDELLNNYGIKSVLCDPTITEEDITTPIVEGSQVLVRKWVASVDSDSSVTLGTLNSHFFSGSFQDKILQIDIEGGEYEAISACNPKTILEYRIIVIEIHALDCLAKPWTKRYQQIVRLCQFLSESFVCVHVHGNNCCGETLIPALDMNVPRVLELSLLRKDRFAKSIAKHNTLPSITPQYDFMQNIPDVAPIILRRGWFLASPQFIESFKVAWPSIAKSALSSWLGCKSEQ